MERNEREASEILRSGPRRGFRQPHRALNVDTIHEAHPPPMAERVLDRARDLVEADRESEVDEDLPQCRRLRALRRELDAREGPQPRQEAPGRTTDQKNVPVPDCKGERNPDDRESRVRWHVGIPFRGSTDVRTANRAERALGAPRGPRATHRGPELHQRLIVLAGFRCGDKARGDRHQPLAPVPTTEVSGEPEHPREDADRVPVDRRHRLPECDARDRTRRVVPDPREGSKVRELFRNLPAMTGGYRLCSAMKVARPPVEYASLPGL